MNAAFEPNVTVSWHLPWRQVARRYAWKEYRMLRGFWLGVAAIAALVMLAVRGFATPPSTPGVLFATAWGAAALYAIGAAVTLFSAEREERTDDFLRLLPAHAPGMLVGKLTAAIVSASLLAVAAAVGGWMIAEFRWPDAASASMVASIGGVALLEALAWGILASLLCPQPLLAAILAIAAASTAAQLAIACTPEAGIGYDWSDYGKAIPIRLAFTAVVALLDLRLAARWLRVRKARVAGGDPREGEGLTSLNGRNALAGTSTWAWSEPSIATPEARAVRQSAACIAGSHVSRRRMYWRLLWQSCREGWPAMLLAIVIGAFLTTAEALILKPLHDTFHDILLPPLTLLAIPALFGALTFRADQRESRYRFLAEHGARPSLVWLARQTAWLMPVLIATLTAILLFLLAVSVFAFDRIISRFGVFTGMHPENDRYLWDYVSDLVRQGELLPSLMGGGAVRVWCAVFAACALGQLASMFIRREVMAGFASILLSVLVALGSYLLYAWELSPLLLVLPVGVAALVATWRRAAGWITERNGWRAWAPPLSIAAAAVVFVAVALPLARLAQVAQPIQLRFERVPLAEAVAQWKRDEPAARDVARRYEQIATKLESADQRSMPELLGQLAELGEAPRCRFTFPDLRTTRRWGGRRNQGALGRHWSNRPLPVFELKQWLLGDADARIDAGELDAAADRVVALWNLEAHLHQYQDESVYGRIGLPDAPLFDANAAGDGGLLMRLATAPGQTSERLKKLIGAHWKAADKFPAADEPIIAAYLEALAVIQGREASYASQAESSLSPAWLAFVANELPWERARAEIALAKLTEARLDVAAAFRQSYWVQPHVTSTGEPAFTTIARQTLLRESRGDETAFWGASDASNRIVKACRTSYLAADELRSRLPSTRFLADMVAQQAARHAEIIRVALVAYQLEHGKYPDKLADLVADYLEGVQHIDPMTGHLFRYRATGFPHPIQLIPGTELIAANTPLVWSPGFGNYQPVASLVPKREPADGAAESGPTVFEAAPEMGPEGGIAAGWLEGETSYWPSSAATEMEQVIMFQPTDYIDGPGVLLLPLPTAE